MNPIAITNAALRAKAAYVPDLPSSQAAFQALGLKHLGMYQDSTHQGVVSQDSQGLYYVSIAGTRWKQGFETDLLDDIWMSPMNAPLGGQISSGAYCGMKDFWNWVWTLVPIGATINIEGHSLGAERVILAPLFIPSNRVVDMYAFEPPRCTTQAYYDAYRAALQNLVVTACGQDYWFSWPSSQTIYVHDSVKPFLWLQDTQAVWTYPNQYKTDGGNISDHSMDEVISRLQFYTQNATFPH